KVRKQLNSLVSNDESEDSVDPLLSQVEELENELNHLENMKKNLYIFSETEGVVGAVNFKKGEKAPSFAALITISPEHPTYIQGFVHENMHTKLKVGNKVEVKSVANDFKIQGKVVSIGSRIIEMPTRLMRVPTTPIWGREIVVQIPENSGFILGEKVQIQPKFSFFGISTAVADETIPRTPDLTYLDPSPITVPRTLDSRFSFEPSGLIYLKDFKKFLVVSDDTDKEDSPYLFLMDRDGFVDDQPIRIPGLKAMTDMESISQLDDKIYLVGSMTKTKKGERKESRELIVRMHRSGLDFSNVESIALKPLLIKLAKDKKFINTELADLVSDGDLEIESSVIRGREFLFGLKEPNKDKKAYILRIKNIDSLFLKKELTKENIDIFARINFGPQKNKHRLSDLALVDGQIYISSVCLKAMCSGIWKLNINGTEATAESVKFFDGFKAEGIAVDELGMMTVTFDQGSEARSFARVPLKQISANLSK
ncbi:MAG: HlyD family efflux transporter periplasmic adaptor subunit, partial [Pseudobdellovibrionaceae bacterium]